MLKSFYLKLEDIPEADRAHYAFQDGRYVLQLEKDHPVLVKNSELLAQHSTDKGTITKLTNEKTALEGSTLPAGHVAVPAADAQLLTAYKTVGTPDEIRTAVNERDTLKTEVTTSKRKDLLRTVAEAEGWPLALLETAGNSLEFEMREVEIEANGKKEKASRAHVLVKGADNRVEAKLFSDYAAGDPTLKELVPLAEAAQKLQKENGGTPFVKQGTKDAPPQPTDTIAKRLEARNQARTANPNALMPKAAAPTK